MYKIFGIVVSIAMAAVVLSPTTTAADDARILRQMKLNKKELNCMALNLYHEARSEGINGLVAVGHVVLNRVANNRFPNTICKVVRQGGEKRRYKCQFSWYCDGKRDRPANKAAWQTAKTIAKAIINGVIEDPTGGAMWYHADYVKPYWAKSVSYNGKIGRHLFYL